MGNNSYKAWWQLDLGQLYWISGIKIFNRERKRMELRERLFGMLVNGIGRYLDGKWAPGFTLFEDYHVASSCSNSYYERGADVCADVIEIEINPAKQLRLINITTPNFLTLCEVELFEVACRVPDAPQHGMYLYPNDTVPRRYIPFNSVIVCSCDTGYSISNSSSALRTCLQSGFFDGGDLSCTTNCQIPPAKNGFYFTNSQHNVYGTVPYGTIIRPNCIKGFSLARGVNRTCQKDGQFSGGNPQCTVVTCSPFGKLENGTLHYTDEQNMNQYVDENKHHTFGVKVRASCDSGFQLVNGSKEQICLEDGTWDGVKPVCGKIRCNDTSLLSLRFQQSSSVFSFLEQGTASYNSSKFYHMNGSLSFICRANGSLSWESQPQELASVCKVQHKEHLLVNTNDCLSEDTCEIGTSISYECVGDYEVSVINASCKADHTWSAEPFCKYDVQSAKASAATIGAAVGGIAVVTAAILLVFFICRQRSKAAKSPTRSHYEIPVKKDADQSDCYSEINVSEIINGEDPGLSRSNSYLTPVVTDSNYYETVSP
ncbi:SVEP1-like protein [Mya arenaria]|uniref:SVEP1-like protein n=1 Tax=Mya arenaria TaxID=6604 RepID=A0ABY7FRE6_MYAAR|nr:SVEP1-like protein [Mya arenaria]